MGRLRCKARSERVVEEAEGEVFSGERVVDQGLVGCWCWRESGTCESRARATDGATMD